MVVYHGSGVVVQHPTIVTAGNTKDFGYAFYCTQDFKQAKRWAEAKSLIPIVNRYDCRLDTSLRVLQFSEMTEAWLDFIVACRKGIAHNYDVVEGPMGDDKIWNYLNDFVAGRISREAFWVLTKFNYPTHQLAFCTQQAINKCLRFRGV